MKIAIMGDFHLGYARFYEDSFAHAELAFSKACEVADLIILAGDLFDSKVPRLEVLDRAMGIFKTAKKKQWETKAEDGGKMPVVAIHGTHERRHKESVNAIQVMEAAGFMKNIHNSKAIFRLGEEVVAVQGLGGVPEEYAPAAMKAAGFSPEPGAFNILVFHQSLKGMVPGNGEMLNLEDLPAGFDIYACGHMHKSHVRKLGNGTLVIPGSTVVTQMRKEETGPKGFVLFDSKTGNHEFIGIRAREFFFEEVEVNNAGPEEIRAVVRKVLGRVSGTGEEPIVKVRVKGTIRKGLRVPDLAIGGADFPETPLLDLEIAVKDSGVERSLELLRDIRTKKLSVRGMGLELLKKKLGETDFSLCEAEELFDKLAEGKSDEIVREHSKRKP